MLQPGMASEARSINARLASPLGLSDSQIGKRQDQKDQRERGTQHGGIRLFDQTATYNATASMRQPSMDALTTKSRGLGAF